MNGDPNVIRYNGVDGLAQIDGWIKGRINRNTIRFADGFGKVLSRKLSTSQIRNVFGEVKRLQMRGWKEDGSTEAALLLLKAKLAYAARKARGKAFELRDVLCKGIDAVVASEDPQKSLDNFADLFEAILAYHRSYGGK